MAWIQIHGLHRLHPVEHLPRHYMTQAHSFAVYSRVNPHEEVPPGMNRRYRATQAYTPRAMNAVGSMRHITPSIRHHLPQRTSTCPTARAPRSGDVFPSTHQAAFSQSSARMPYSLGSACCIGLNVTRAPVRCLAHPASRVQTAQSAS